ncbi:hypothetical protein EMIT079MI2_80143 [Bacillus sp. IT-79MI2]
MKSVFVIYLYYNIFFLMSSLIDPPKLYYLQLFQSTYFVTINVEPIIIYSTIWPFSGVTLLLLNSSLIRLSVQIFFSL